MWEYVKMFFALLLILSPLALPVACFAAQVFLFDRRPPLLLLLPVLTGLMAFGWFPEHWNEFARVLYVLDAFGAFVGSVAGGVVCAAANWRKWF